MTPIFEIFDRIGPHCNLIDPLFLQKNQFVSITFSSRYLDLNLVKFFIKMYYCIYCNFLSILYQFSPWFSIQLTPFFINLISFWPLIFTKPDWIGSNLISRAEPVYQTFCEVPPPPKKNHYQASLICSAFNSGMFINYGVGEGGGAVNSAARHMNNLCELFLRRDIPGVRRTSEISLPKTMNMRSPQMITTNLFLFVCRNTIDWILILMVYVYNLKRFTGETAIS